MPSYVWIALIVLFLIMTRNIWKWIFIGIFLLGSWLLSGFFNFVGSVLGGVFGFLGDVFGFRDVFGFLLELLGEGLQSMTPTERNGGYPVLFAKLLTIGAVIGGLVYWIRK